MVGEEEEEEEGEEEAVTSTSRVCGSFHASICSSSIFKDSHSPCTMQYPSLLAVYMEGLN